MPVHLDCSAAGAVTIVVAPIGRGRFAAYIASRRLVVSPTPFLDAARVLLAQGHAPATILQSRRPDRAACCWDLRATIGVAARLTVDERTGTRFRRWEPSKRFRGAARSPIEYEGAGTPGLPEDDPRRRPALPTLRLPEIEEVGP
jgi:hypothetical protein